MPAKWVPVRWIIKLTGWDKNDLRAARKDGLVKFRYDSVNGFQYDVNSIPQVFIKTNTNETSTAHV